MHLLKLEGTRLLQTEESAAPPQAAYGCSGDNSFELGILIYSSIKLLPIDPYSPRRLQHLIIAVGNADM